jgi:ATP-dependent helicase HepA
LFESLGLFERPLGGLQRELAGVESAIEELALGAPEMLDDFGPSHFTAIVERAHSAYDRIRQAAYHELHRDPYHDGLAEGLLARVPDDLEELTEGVVLAAAEQLGLYVEPHRGGVRHSIELGRHARVESLPGVPGGSSFLGTFRREDAVEDEGIDFYASGHPLVEGILSHLEESPIGRVGLLHVHGSADEDADGFGVLAIYKVGPGFEAVALDAHGHERADWAALLTDRPLRTRRVKPESWTGQPGWPQLVRSLARRLERRGNPVAVAAFRIDARRGRI